MAWFLPVLLTLALLIVTVNALLEAGRVGKLEAELLRLKKDVEALRENDPGGFDEALRALLSFEGKRGERHG